MAEFVVRSILATKYVIDINMQPVAATPIVQLIKCIGHRKPKHYNSKIIEISLMTAVIGVSLDFLY